MEIIRRAYARARARTHPPTHARTHVRSKSRLFLVKVVTRTCLRSHRDLINYYRARNVTYRYRLASRDIRILIK